MQVPTDRQYSTTHEWFLTEGDVVTIGITQYAADTLTDITYVELRPVGTVVDIGDAVAELESIKAVADVLSVMIGEIIEVNGKLEDNPELINDDAFEKSWMVKLKVKAESIASVDLMSAEEYTKLCAE